MDQFQKLALLSENMDVEEGEANNFHSASAVKEKNHPLITQAKLPNGQNFPLLKSMITSVCEKNCNYCAFRSGRDCQRATFKPDEMADTYLSLNEKKIAKGLFLSSGIVGGGAKVQDKIIDTAAILRNKRNYKGYMHLKIMPGAEYDQIFQLMHYADRVSINLEAPNGKRLSDLAPKKDFYDELLNRLFWADQIRKRESPVNTWKGNWPSISTQFVVGPSGETDLELIKTSVYLIQKYNLARIYFMTFNPVLNTPMENTKPENPLRGHRLYQSSYLIRDYGFQLEDFSFAENGHLSLEKDPKQIWAERHLLDHPLEINQADPLELIRIPGIGPKRAKLITDFRRQQLIRSEGDLRHLGIPINKVGRFLLLNGKKAIHQLSLFPV